MTSKQHATNPGSGYWTPVEGVADTWSNDDRIWFHYIGRAIVFIQFDDFNNAELLKLAHRLGAMTARYRINAGWLREWRASQPIRFSLIRRGVSLLGDTI
ncbi:MAG: hypothetical protein K0U72_10105 [Gammaproteobacteria bacterium]|nr:hypothetical protein [Gammaproteobacteria bacterium]